MGTGDVDEDKYYCYAGMGISGKGRCDWVMGINKGCHWWELLWGDDG